MDPNATWNDIITELGVSNYVEAYAFAVRLQRWLDNDGFIPTYYNADLHQSILNLYFAIDKIDEAYHDYLNL